ncbi:CLIP domain-containing serine protease HP8-like isoform X1 [Cydia pomonella]|uniref:CLIP domain-containing serine protease HP8-like isoform X1 n=1 Tax=Cydia pomonella TaxID=82600 RepID=UPI002ADD4022|nr:CLIP domain-containing serine protease HP8-like isoform X1 [Cydia pomonella]
MLHKILCFVALAIAVTAQDRKCNNDVACIPLVSCSGLNSQLQNGRTEELVVLLRKLHCGFDHDDPKVCCPPEFQTESQPNRIGVGFTGSAAPGSFPDPTSSGDSDSLLPNNKVCGIQTNDRIVGGEQTELDEHPWTALLRYDKPRGSGFYCGGVLISSRYVMTAAHCVKGADLPHNWRLSQVRLGEWNTSSTTDCYGGECHSEIQDVPVEQVIAHENYDPNNTNQHDDIALLRLARKVQFTDFIKPICLPSTDALRTNTFEDYDMEVAGWGKTETRDEMADPPTSTVSIGSESDVKLKVRVPVVTMSECSQVFRPVGRRIINKQICAGGVAGRDSCRGDSGGALMGRVPTVDNWIAVGVVSYGPSPCGTAGWPGVYTRVGAYFDWIVSKLRP